MRRDHAPITKVSLRVTVDFRDDDLRARYVKAHAAQVQRDADRDWRSMMPAPRTEQAALSANVLVFGKASK